MSVYTDAPTERNETNALDTIFDVLSNRRRRYVLYRLANADGSIGFDRLAGRVAADVRNAEIREVTSDERRRVAVSLRQIHLPKLADVGLVTYDEARDAVGLSGDASRLRNCLQRTAQAELD